MSRHISNFLLILFATVVSAQNEDSVFIRRIFDEALANGQSYSMLKQLCKQFPHRLCGSEGAQGAAEWSREEMIRLGFENARLQNVKVPHWLRGQAEDVSVTYTAEGNKQIRKMHACALGGSIGTPPEGIQAPVTEVMTFEELKGLGKKEIKGKIVFFNRPMDPKKIETFRAYGGAVDQRTSGAIEAAKLGAVAVIIRSMTLALDHFPHTGAMRYQEGVAKIPEVAISTLDAEFLHEILQKTTVHAFIKMDCKYLPEVMSYNVICEMHGQKHPDQVILAGGHLDAWDLGEGAHDDASGCVQSLEALRILKQLGYHPNNTLRTVFFMNEEFGLNGGKTYADSVRNSGERHLLAIESDRGAFLPLGFSFMADDQTLARIRSWKALLAPYGLYVLKKGFGGSDISPLSKLESTSVTAGLIVNSQAYFDYHHAASNVFEAVNRRELELGAASIAAMMYLVDKYGMK